MASLAKALDVVLESRITAPDPVFQLTGRELDFQQLQQVANPDSSLEMAHQNPRFELNPVTFYLGLTPAQYQRVITGAFDDDELGWTLERLEATLGSKFPSRVAALAAYLQRQDAALTRVRRLILEPSPDELAWEYDFDPRSAGSLIYLRDPMAEIRVVSLEGDRNPALTQELGTSWRLVPRAATHRWARLAQYHQLRLSQPWSQTGGARWWSLMLQILDPHLATRDALPAIQRLLENFQLRYRLSAAQDLSAEPPLLLGQLLALQDLWLTEVATLASYRFYNPQLGPELPAQLRRLLTLEHPQLVTFEGFGVSNYNLYLYFIPAGHTLASQPPAPDTDLNLSRQLSRAVLYLHQRGIVHNRMIPALIYIEGSDLKLGYFDHQHLDGTLAERTRAAGEPERDLLPYRDPEVYLSFDLYYSTDIYALAWLIYQLVSGLVPFGPDSPEADCTRCYAGRSQPWILKRVLDGYRPSLEALPQDLAALLTQMWDLESRRRPTAGQVLRQLDYLVATAGLRSG